MTDAESTDAAPSRLAGSPGGGPLFARRGRRRCSSRSASRTSRCTRGGTRSRTACSGARAPKASRAVEVARRIGRRRARASSAATCCSRSTARRSRRRPTSSSYQHRAHDGHAARLHAASARHAAGARRRRSRRRRAAARCISCSRRSACSRCSSARRCGCAGRAIRRRCISSGCASRSSASSRSRSTGRSIGSTGSFYWGDAVAMALLPPLLLHFTLVFPERPRRRGRGALGRRSCRCMYLPALVLGARARSSRSRAGRVDGAAVLARARCCSIAPSRSTCSSARRRRSSCWCARFGEITSLTGAAPAALDCVGHGARRRPVRVRLRAAVGVRRRTRRWRCS